MENCDILPNIVHTFIHYRVLAAINLIYGQVSHTPTHGTISVSQIDLSACLWTVAGIQSTLRKPTHSRFHPSDTSLALTFSTISLFNALVTILSPFIFFVFFPGATLLLCCYILADLVVMFSQTRRILKHNKALCSLGGLLKPIYCTLLLPRGGRCVQDWIERSQWSKRMKAFKSPRWPTVLQSGLSIFPLVRGYIYKDLEFCSAFHAARIEPSGWGSCL